MGLRGKDPALSGDNYRNWLRDNDWITYPWNHIFLKKIRRAMKWIAR